MEPDVPWVADGQRLNPDRDELNKQLKRMYTIQGHGSTLTPVWYITGSYQERLNKAIELVNGLFK